MVVMTVLTLQPELFALMGIDLFLLLSLVTCLLDERFPKPIPYIYQIAAIYGFLHLLISRNYLDMFGEYTRFWYSFLYLAVALANVVAINVYFAVIKQQYTISKIWSGALTFPSILVTVYFVTQYSAMQNSLPSIVLQISLLISACALGIFLSILANPGIFRKLLHKKKRR
jgi:small-conductance mechanosensitive channel